MFQPCCRKRDLPHLEWKEVHQTSNKLFRVTYPALQIRIPRISSHNQVCNYLPPLTQVFTKYSGVIRQKLESQGKKEKSIRSTLGFSLQKAESRAEVLSEHIRFSVTTDYRRGRKEKSTFLSPPTFPTPVSPDTQSFHLQGVR